MIANLISILNSSTPGEASTYRSVVNADGGTVTDYDYLKARIKHAKDNGYFDSIVWWGSPSFGVKQSAGLASKLYDVIDIDNNSLVSTVGSEQPEFIASAQNGKPTLRGDGIQSALYTTHSNNIIGNNKEYVMLFIFNPITNLASTARTLVQGKLSNYLNIVQMNISLVYGMNVSYNGAAGLFALKQRSGISNASFSVLAFNMRDKATWMLNDITGGYVNNGKSLPNYSLQGLSLFGNYVADPTAFLASRTNYDFYELMIIESGAIGYSLLHDIKKQANDYYNAYPSFEFEKSGRLLDGVLNLEGVFSFKNRVTGYAGNCIRLRRSSDNVEQDFGFVSDYIDLAAINTFKGASTVFVRTWYDQSGSSNFDQATNSAQPQFFTTGGGNDSLQPYIQFISASSTKLNRTSTLSSADLFRTYIVTKETAPASVLWASGGSTSYVNIGNMSGYYVMTKRIGATSYGRYTDSYWDTTGVITPMLIMGLSNNSTSTGATTMSVHFQTYEDLFSSALGQNIEAGTNVMSIGGGATGPLFNGVFHELIVVKDVTHNQATIENNLAREFQQLP